LHIGKDLTELEQPKVHLDTAAAYD